MFQKSKAFTSFAVKDLEETRHFYGQILGLDIAEVPGMDDILDLHLAGGSQVLVYRKPDHTPAVFTILNFEVADIEAAVKRLTGQGVQFEQYEGDLKTDEKGIFRGGPLVAWFRDPSGNILSVIEEK